MILKKIIPLSLVSDSFSIIRPRDKAIENYPPRGGVIAPRRPNGSDNFADLFSPSDSIQTPNRTIYTLSSRASVNALLPPFVNYLVVKLREFCFGSPPLRRYNFERCVY